jgi:hypothetical protein
MKPMWLGSFQIVHVDTLGKGFSAGLAAGAGAVSVDPEEPEPPPLEPEPAPPEPASRLNGNWLSELEAAGDVLAFGEAKTEWSASESCECACSGGGGEPYVGTKAPE